ncbi:uncharacterized protein H6S33_001428 [Morchella sextelata]|uniref:uncharacterized protein n=1 Tax=Morchella sextelata TaxID=1174677 RepID=UPI001D04DD6C|nr:uncharacterized protein H6S33_001428 [Morchella sextelata]KAH0609200.1 hypothetical protein H6S33_001428 [Morchella sextelata]
MSSSKRQPSIEITTEDLNEALSEIANGLVRDQQDIALEDLSEVESIAGDSSIGENETARALARINSDSCEKMRQRYVARNQELMQFVSGLSPRSAMIAVELWKKHVQLYDKFIDAIMDVFQMAAKAMLNKLMEALKNAYQKIKDIFTLVCQSVQKLFS